MRYHLTAEIIKAFHGIVPPTIATSSASGIPNITYISKIQPLGNDQVALSWQFFNKTWKNILENPQLIICVTCPDTGSLWELRLRYLETQTSGNLFDEMHMMIDLMASLQGQAGVFKLAAAVICQVEAVKVLYDGTNS